MARFVLVDTRGKEHLHDPDEGAPKEALKVTLDDAFHFPKPVCVWVRDYHSPGQKYILMTQHVICIYEESYYNQLAGK